MKKDDVEIRVVEAGCSFSDNLFYHCQFRRKGAWFWTNFVVFMYSSGEVVDDVRRNPYAFGHLAEYNYEQCCQHNKEAYTKREAYQKEREKNKCIRLK